MKKRSVAGLGEAEMECLQHVWQLGQATVSDVHQRVLQHREVAYTTIMTVMANLVKKGYLRSERVGGANVFTPARPADEVQKGLLGNLIDKVFQGSPAAMAQALVTREDLSDADREEILAIISRLREKS